MAISCAEPRIQTQGSPFIHYAEEGVAEDPWVQARVEETVLLKHHPAARLRRHGSWAGFAPFGLLNEERQRALKESLHAAREAKQARLVQAPGWLSAALREPLPAVPLVRPGERTLMVRNLPPHVPQKEVLQLLAQYGFEGAFDFVYMPSSFETGQNKGYLFVNLTNEAAAERLRSLWDGRRPFGHEGTPLSVSHAVIQGLQGNTAKWAGPRAKRVRNPNLRPYIRGHADFDPALRKLV